MIKLTKLLKNDVKTLQLPRLALTSVRLGECVVIQAVEKESQFSTSAQQRITYYFTATEEVIWKGSG
jgi:hypothetical protein